ncbi:hypothetical protein KQ246_06995 [Pseudoalteromonas shioyasakiensis]|nr:hypothetical protein KQ246_06995 [Pseudoalteromonas shioyasakiensis]
MSNKIIDPFTKKEIEFIDPFAEEKTESGIAASFGAGVDKLEELGYRAVKGFTDVGESAAEQEAGSLSESVAKTIGKDGSLSQWAQEGIERNIEEQNSYEPTVKSYKDIDSLSDFASYAGELTAGSIPYMAGAATGVGAFGMAGGLAQEAYEKQPEGEKDATRAVVSGAGQMLLERLGIKASMGQLGKDILRDGVLETAKRYGKGELTEAVRDPSIAKRLLKGAVGEGVTETGQEALAQWGAGKSLDEFEKLDEAFVGGLVVGGIVRTGSEATQKALSYQQRTAEVVKNSADSLVESGVPQDEAIDMVRVNQFEAAKKQGFTDAEASAIVARTMKEKFGIDNDLFNAASQPEPLPEQVTSNENVTTNPGENEAERDVNYDTPTAARQAGFGESSKDIGQYGDFISSPTQESLRNLEQGNGSPSIQTQVSEARLNTEPTPEDRFSPIKYTYEGDYLEAEPEHRQGIEKAPIEGTAEQELGKLPTSQETADRQAREKVFADLAAQPEGIEQKDIIFAEDGRPKQEAQQRVEKAGRDAENLLPHKDIIFSGDQSGINVQKDGQPFKSKRDALLSKEARAARRAGDKTKAVSFDNGFGWTIKSPAQNKGKGTEPASEEATGQQADIKGEMIDSEWQAFSPQSQTKKIPRAEMPQIKAENRGAMVNFMKARGIEHKQDTVSAQSLKPTQAEFSPNKVTQAKEYEGGERSILVSNDNHILDGHHQWLAASEKGKPVKIIRLDAPIERLVALANEMPSTETQNNTGKLTVADSEEANTSDELNGDIGKPPEQKAEENTDNGQSIGQDLVTLEQTNELPPILKTSKRKWLQAEAKKQGLKKDSPGYEAAMKKLDEGYESAVDKAFAEQSFETYQRFNADTPESINRQAYNELRKEFGIKDKEPPTYDKTPEQNAEPPQSGFSVPSEQERKQTSDSEVIEDFGEKLGGARKDLWGGFAESLDEKSDSIKSKPLSKALPQPDYQKMSDEGADPKVLTFIAMARGSIPSKPKLSHKVSDWADYVDKVKQSINRVLKEGADPESEINLLSHFMRKGTLNGAKEALGTIANANPAILKEASKYRIRSAKYSLFNGKEHKPAKTFYTIEKQGRRISLDNAVETLEEAQKQLAEIIKIESQSTNRQARHSKINVFRDRYTGQVYLGWKGASGVLKIQDFKTPGEAREHLSTNRDAVEEKLQKLKSTPNMRKPVNAERTGPERHSDNVTPGTFTEAFGFRGVEFGNWVEQGKRQKDLNQAYDALMDLAEAIDVPPKALSLNGQLGLAFGARGTGGKEPAAAHYESGNMVINLTKKSGSGSLAHEWWHALDNYFGRQKNSGSDFITESPYHLKGDEVRPEMAEAFKRLRNVINASDLPRRSLKLDQRKSKKYWSTNVEMTARSFETFIIDKLNKGKIKNEYLANVVSDEAWSAAESLGFEDGNTFPYPLSSEQTPINEAYQALFDTIEHKETPEGIKFFSKSNAKEKAKGVAKGDAEKTANSFIKSLNGANGINVHVLESTNDAEKLWRMSLSDSIVKGAYNDKTKTVYVIAENIESESDLKRTLAHETIAHGGLDTVIGKEAHQEFLNRIKKTKGRKAFEQYWKDANKDYWDSSDDVKAEEIFARFVENEPSKGELKYWWQALKRWLKAQLDKAGIVYREDDEITHMREMLHSIVKGFKSKSAPYTDSIGELAYSQTGNKFSQTTTADKRTAKEKLGLTESAQKTLSDKAKERTAEVMKTLKSAPFWNRLNEGIFDGLAGIKQAEEAIGVTDPNKQGYVSARLAAGVSDVLHGVFNYGAPQWKDGIIQRKENTKGLLEVFSMVENDLNDWLAWMGAHRAERLKAQGRENNLSKADIEELKSLAKGKEKLFEEVRAEYNKINSAILDVAQGAGLINTQQRRSFDEEYYVPFFRDMGETDPEMDAIKRSIVEPHTRKGIAGQSAQIKELKGGKQSTKDLLENIITRQSTLIEASLKNKAMQEVVSNLDGTDFMIHEKSDDAKSMTQEELNRNSKVRVMINGEPQAYLVSDPALMRSLIQVNSSGSQNIVNKIGRSAKRFLTAGITLSPDFIAKNFIRDAAHAWMINKDGFKFGADSVKGLKKAFKEDEAYRDLIFSGAAFQGGYIHGADPEAAAQQTRRALAKKGLSDNEINTYLGSLVTNGKQLLETYRNISDKVENANRLSTYEAALANNKSKRQAAFEAKDLMDYSLKGNFTTINFMVDVLPFFNARLQGMSKLVRAAKAQGDDQLVKVLSRELAMKGIKVAAFSLALAMYNDDDERYQALPDWDKDANWHFFSGDDHWRIPKPFELGVIFGTIPERLFNYAAGNQSSKDLQKSLMHAALTTMALNPTPQFILPLVETSLNRSFFRDAPIEGMADQNKQAQDRYSAFTSDTAIALGKTLGWSPKKIEHVILGYTGTMGSYVLGISDMIARQAIGKVNAETPLNRYPVIKSFYQGDTPKSNTKFANEFYDALDAANQAYGSYKRAMELGDTTRIKELLEDDGSKLRSRAGLAKVQRSISKLTKAKSAINDSRQLTSSQKREQIDKIQKKINIIYHKAYLAFRLGEM